MLFAALSSASASSLEGVSPRPFAKLITLFAIVQNAPIGILVLDSAHQVSTVNATFSSMVGREFEHLINQPIENVMPEQLLGPIIQAIKSGKPFQISRLKVVRPGLQSYWNLSLWHVPNNGTVILVDDCTRTVLLEQQRDDFVAAVAHDIKNPLIGAQRIFDALCDQSVKPSQEKHAAMLSMLRDSNQNLLSLMQNLVDVYRYETLSFPCHYEEVNLTPIIHSCINQISHFAEAHAVILQNAATEPLSIQSDAVGIRRVLMNLLHNAVKFSKQGGTVTVAVARLDDTIEMRVSDTGNGISDSDQQKLFQRYVQGSDRKRDSIGTGLGLYLCKQIVQALGGNITCQSKLGSGTTFVVSLPSTNPAEKEMVSDVHQSSGC